MLEALRISRLLGRQKLRANKLLLEGSRLAWNRHTWVPQPGALLPFLFCWGGGFPHSNRQSRKRSGTLILSSLLEDLLSNKHTVHGFARSDSRLAAANSDTPRE